MTPQQEASNSAVSQYSQPQGGGGGGFLGSLLPMGGAVGGGILGTLLGGPLGGVAGAAGGSALGQEAENLGTGSTGSTLGAAESGAIGQGVGGVLGKLGGMALGKLGTMAGDAASTAAYKGLPVADVLSHAQELGIDTSDPQALLDFTNQWTGGQGAYASDMVRGAMENHNMPVDLTSTRALANNIANSYELQQGQSLSPRFTQTINKLLGLDEPGTINQIPASDVYQARQKLSDLAFSPTTAPALRTAYRDLMNSMDGALSISGIDHTMIANGIPDEVMQAAEKVSPEFASRLQAAASQGVGAMRSFQAPLMDLKDAATQALNKANVVGGKQGTASMGGGPAMGLLGMVGHWHPALTAAAIGSKAASHIPPEMMQNITGALERLNPGMTGGALGAAVAEGPNAQNNQGNQGGAMSPTAQGGTATGTGGGYDPNQLAQYLMQAIQVNPYAAASLAPVLASVQGPIRQAGQAQAALGGLQNEYNQATGGPGILNALMGLIPGTAANQYNRQRGSVEAQLSALGLPSALPSVMASPGTAQAAFAAPAGALSAMGQPATFQGNPPISPQALLSTLPLGY